ISMNLTNIRETPLHEAFEACRKSANQRGLRVTGSELVGLVPLSVMLEAGKYFLRQQRRSVGVSERELIRMAIKSLGLDELSPFDPDQKIIEYQLQKHYPKPLINMKLDAFANETASESPAPGGGSIAAYVGALGISLGGMVANLSAHRRIWDDRWEEFSIHAEQAQQLKDQLLNLVDEDTNAFNRVMDALRLPKGTEAEKTKRSQAIQAATKYAIEVPLQVMKVASDCFPLLHEMAQNGNPNSVSDAGVGALCTRAAIHGAFLNVQINVGDYKDKVYVEQVLAEGQALADAADQQEQRIMGIVQGVMNE
ncbi:MAG: cyclodeaminase/cyclohydrolase family protein, partial [Bacteroidota bacterium]